MATRLNKGIYQFEAKGKTFQVEKDEYGLWTLYAMVEMPCGEIDREYWQDFTTKATAIAAAKGE